MPMIDITPTHLIILLDGESFHIPFASILTAQVRDRAECRMRRFDDFSVRMTSPLPDGYRILLGSQKAEALIPVEFRVTGNSLRVSVPAAEIIETRGDVYRLMRLDLLPDLMRTSVGDAGFFLLPCYSGTMIRFVDHAPQVIKNRIYMEQEHWERLVQFNAFCLNHDGRGLLAIVHEGDFACHVTTELNQDGVNRQYASFRMRHAEQDVLPCERKTLHIHRLGGTEADYPGMARRYRDYLVTERSVAPLAGRLSANPTLAYATSAMRVKIFLGRKERTPDGTGAFRINTTFAQAEEILDAMHAIGITRAVVTLVGWNAGGHDGEYPTRFPVEPAVGGETGLRRLIAKALGMGFQIVPHDNWTDCYRVASGFDDTVMIHTRAGELQPAGVWGGGQAFKSCPTVVFDRYGNDFERVKALGFQGCYYMDAQSMVLWRCDDPRHPADEALYATAQNRLLQWPRAHYGAVSTELGVSHSLPFVDEIACIISGHNGRWMLDHQTKAFRSAIDRIVPFYHLAVHGLVTYQDSWIHRYRGEPGGVRAGWLRALAYGARPSMEVSHTGGGAGDPYADSLRDVLPAYRAAFDELADTHAEMIESFEELGPCAARTVFGNGQILTVNWGLETVEGLLPLSYAITSR